MAARCGQRVEARRALGLKDDEVALGVASRLVPDKGHAFLLDAVRRALSDVPHLRLLIAGIGPLRLELEDHSRDLPEGSVEFLGFLPDVRALHGGLRRLRVPYAARVR